MKYWRNIIAERRTRTVVIAECVVRGASGQDADADVAIRDPVAVVLERDVAGARPSVPGPLRELGCRHLRLPRRGPQLVLDHLHAVEPVLDVRPVDDEADGIPFAGGLHRAPGRGIEAKVGAR